QISFRTKPEEQLGSEIDKRSEIAPVVLVSEKSDPMEDAVSAVGYLGIGRDGFDAMIFPKPRCNHLGMETAAVDEAGASTFALHSARDVFCHRLAALSCAVVKRTWYFPGVRHGPDRIPPILAQAPAPLKGVRFHQQVSDGLADRGDDRLQVRL